MVIAEVSAIVTSVKATIEIVKDLKFSKGDHAIVQAHTEIRERLLTILSDAIALQEKHSALINEKDALTKKLMEFEQWKQTESEYELKQIVPGTYVYSYKNSQQSEIPPHWLCEHCWNDRKKSVLQKLREFPKGATYVCHRCEFGFVVHSSQLL